MCAEDSHLFQDSLPGAGPPLKKLPVLPQAQEFSRQVFESPGISSGTVSPETVTSNGPNFWGGMRCLLTGPIEGRGA